MDLPSRGSQAETGSVLPDGGPPCHELAGVPRARPAESLRQVAAEIGRDISSPLVVRALCSDEWSPGMAHVDDGSHPTSSGPDPDTSDEYPIDLDGRDRPLVEMRQRRVAVPTSSIATRSGPGRDEPVESKGCQVDRGRPAEDELGDALPDGSGVLEAVARAG